MKNSLTLPTGSEISIQSSFLNQKGITGSSIELLEDVVEDYKSYYDIIKKQKQQQYNTLVKISDYINSVSQDLNKTDNILKKTNEDQREILAEMNKIKREIDELVFD